MAATAVAAAITTVRPTALDSRIAAAPDEDGDARRQRRRPPPWPSAAWSSRWLSRGCSRRSRLLAGGVAGVRILCSPHGLALKTSPPDGRKAFPRTRERPGQDLERGSGTEPPELTRIRLIAVVAFGALAQHASPSSGFSIEALVDALACGVLVAVTVTDLERRIVPNRIIVPALVVALVVQTVRDPSVEWIARLARGGRLLPRRSAHLPRRPRHGRRQARRVSRSVARRSGDRGALRGLAARGDPRRRDPGDAGSEGAEGGDSLRAVPRRRAASSRCSSATRSSTGGSGRSARRRVPILRRVRRTRARRTMRDSRSRQRSTR